MQLGVRIGVNLVKSGQWSVVGITVNNLVVTMAIALSKKIVLVTYSILVNAISNGSLAP